MLDIIMFKMKLTAKDIHPTLILLLLKKMILLTK